MTMIVAVRISSGYLLAADRCVTVNGQRENDVCKLYSAGDLCWVASGIGKHNRRVAEWAGDVGDNITVEQLHQEFKDMYTPANSRWVENPETLTNDNTIDSTSDYTFTVYLVNKKTLETVRFNKYSFLGEITGLHYHGGVLSLHSIMPPDCTLPSDLNEPGALRLAAAIITMGSVVSKSISSSKEGFDYIITPLPASKCESRSEADMFTAIREVFE